MMFCAERHKWVWQAFGGAAVLQRSLVRHLAALLLCHLLHWGSRFRAEVARSCSCNCPAATPSNPNHLTLLLLLLLVAGARPAITLHLAVQHQTAQGACHFQLI
jgi:hypothetical protein